jgi:nitric oxide reductase NorE protein
VSSPVIVAAPVRTDAAPDRRSMPGVEGFWVFVAGDLAIFTLMFVTFLVARDGDVAGYDAARATLDVDRGGVNTLVLLTSSACVATALARLRAGASASARHWIAAGLAGGLAFVVLKSTEYPAAVSVGHTPAESDFFVYYIALTAVHLGHVIVGCLVLGLYWARLRRPAASDPVGFQTAAAYWHLVDFLWLVIFPLLYLLR